MRAQTHRFPMNKVIAIVTEPIFFHVTKILLHLPPTGMSTKKTSTARSLSNKQERKLVQYLEEHFLDITASYKKR